MGRIDENQEVVARIQLAIEAYDQSRMPDDVIGDEEIPEQEEDDRAQRESRSWRIGAPDRQTTASWLQEDFMQKGMVSSFHRNFEANLKEFLIANTTCDSVRIHTTIKVSRCLKLFQGCSLHAGPSIGASL